MKVLGVLEKSTPTHQAEILPPTPKRLPHANKPLRPHAQVGSLLYPFAIIIWQFPLRLTHIKRPREGGFYTPRE